MRELALKDPLTGLANRRLFDLLAERQLIMALRNGYSLYLLYIDLDNFKKINDLHGHRAGDQTLQLFVEKVSGKIRKTDIFARLGGDEFVILPCRMTDLEALKHLCDKIMNLTAEIPHILNLNTELGCSIGVSKFPVNGKSLDELIKSADTSMYKSKGEGKNTTSYSF